MPFSCFSNTQHCSQQFLRQSLFSRHSSWMRENEQNLGFETMETRPSKHMANKLWSRWREYVYRTSRICQNEHYTDSPYRIKKLHQLHLYFAITEPNKSQTTTGTDRQQRESGWRAQGYDPKTRERRQTLLACAARHPLTAAAATSRPNETTQTNQRHPLPVGPLPVRTRGTARGDDNQSKPRSFQVLVTQNKWEANFYPVRVLGGIVLAL